MKEPNLPNKIYFSILDVGGGYVYTPSLENNGGTEYILKDALFEMLKGYSHPLARVVVQELIDKINEL